MYVDDDGGNAADYETVVKAATSIQTAIDHINNLTGADLTDGGGDNVIIYILNGTYSATVIINAYITSAANDIKILNYPGHTHAGDKVIHI